MEGSLLGLGYRGRGSRRNKTWRRVVSSSASGQKEEEPTAATTATAATEEWMDLYLQQCLVYHQEQQILRHQEAVLDQQEQQQQQQQQPSPFSNAPHNSNNNNNNSNNNNSNNNNSNNNNSNNNNSSNSATLGQTVFVAGGVYQRKDEDEQVAPEPTNESVPTPPSSFPPRSFQALVANANRNDEPLTSKRIKVEQRNGGDSSSVQPAIDVKHEVDVKVASPALVKDHDTEGNGKTPLEQAIDTATCSIPQKVEHRTGVSVVDTRSNETNPALIQQIPLESSKIDSTTVETNKSASPQTGTPVVKKDPSGVDENAVEAGRRRAQAILQRFHEQQQQFLYQKSLPSVAITSASVQLSSSSPALQQQPFQSPVPHVPLWLQAEPEPSIFLEQRRRGMQRENRRRRQALVKNLEYVAAREAQQAAALENEIHRAREQQLQAQQEYQRKLAHRKEQQAKQQQQLWTSQAGIGTKLRHKVERAKARQGHQVVNNTPAADVGVYLTGLPRDGSISVDVIRQLLEVYGTIKKVHFYRHKKTGNLKGDGLVVFDLSQEEADRRSAAATALLEAVCSQMNGVELGDGGTVLTVEPAESPSNQEWNKSLDHGKAAPSNVPVVSGETLSSLPTAPTASASPDEASKKEAQDDDLDEFFASL